MFDFAVDWDDRDLVVYRGVCLKCFGAWMGKSESRERIASSEARAMIEAGEPNQRLTCSCTRRKRGK